MILILGESFKDFTIRKMLRNLPPQHEDNDHSDQSSSASSEDAYVPSKSKTTQKTPITSKRTLAPSSSKATTTPTTTRELRARVLQTKKGSQPSPGPLPSLPLIKNPPPESDDDFDANNEPDNDFTNFSPGDDPDPQDGQDSDSDYSIGTLSYLKKRKSSAGPSYSKTKRKSKPPPNRKECPECHGFWKPEAFEKHFKTHSKQRNLKCRFCDKRFIERKHVAEHERSHNLAKYGKMCRVEGCGQLCLDRSKQLKHERRCIQKKLIGGGFVNEDVLEDVRRRSQKVDLGWPEKETEDSNENNEAGILNEGVEMGEGEIDTGNNIEEEDDPLAGIDIQKN